MTAKLHLTLQKLLFWIEERDLQTCGCRQMGPKLVTPKIRKAMDETYAAMLNEEIHADEGANGGDGASNVHLEEKAK